MTTKANPASHDTPALVKALHSPCLLLVSSIVLSIAGDVIIALMRRAVRREAIEATGEHLLASAGNWDSEKRFTVRTEGS